MCLHIALLLNIGAHVLLLVLTTILRSTGLKYDPRLREEDTGSEVTRALHTLRPKRGQLQNKPSAAHHVGAPSCTLAAVDQLTPMRTQAQLLLYRRGKGVHAHTAP